jgi:ATP-binding cassette subfamily B protein
MLWPTDRVGEALRTLAGAGGAPAVGDASGGPPADASVEEISAWLSAAAEREGLQADRVHAAFSELSRTLTSGTPVLLRVSTPDGPAFLLVLDGRGRSTRILTPDLQVQRVSLAQVCLMVRLPFELPVESEVDDLLDRLAIPSGARLRARDALLAERLAATRIGGCWLLRPALSGGFRSIVKEARLGRGLAILTIAHLIQSVLFVASWWLLGRGLLSGTLDRGWLAGWALLLVSLVPFRLLTSWMQGLLAVSAGSALRRRLLRGALRIDAQQVREKGAGQFFSLVSEAGAVESLALTGGIVALLAVLELSVAAVILWSSAGAVPVLLLAILVGATGWLTARYAQYRASWTTRRLTMTHRLLEGMVGHRTRLVQQSADRRHREEDDVLDRYVEAGSRMDDWELRLLALVPRAWLACAMAALAPAAVTGMAPGYLAAAVGGMLLAFRALRRLTIGVSDVTGAVIASRIVAPLVHAAERREAPASPSMVIVRPSQGGDGLVAQARDLVFRYRPGGEPVLHGCSLRVHRGTRLLVEGPSGSGKTTFASILSGLQAPDSGLLLVDGLDRSVLGAAGWRSRVAMAPQSHDNYLISGSLAFNLLMGRRWPALDADVAEAEQVCRELGLGELIDRMPGGLFQLVGETGWQLSQGERTRVFLARAILQRPALLVLDESFSALDPENVDRAVRCVVQRAPTVLAIAHT